MNGEKQSNEAAGRAKAGNIAALRALVAAYLVYLGVSLIRDMLKGSSTMTPWVAWLCGLFFLAAGLGFGWYTWRRYRAERDAAAAEEKPEEKPED